MRNYSISQRNKSRGSKVWYGRTFEDGVLIREESLKTTSKADAKAWLDMKNAARFRPELDQDSKIGTARAMNEYMDYCSNRRSKNYVGWLNANVRRKLGGWMKSNGKDSINGMTRADADSYYDSTSGMMESSRRSVITGASSFFKWAIERYGLEMKNPFEGIKMTRNAKRAKAFWTDEQIDLILDNAVNPYDRAFMAVMAFSGLRHFETSMFGPSMISEGRIHVIGKFSKEAFIPISDRLNEELSKVEITEGMFKAYEDNEVANNRIRKAVLAAGMDVKDATCHKFRHSFISNLCRKGVDIKSIQMLARHEDVSLTLNTYSHLLQSDLKDAINTKKEG